MDIDLVYLWVNGNDPKWQASATRASDDPQNDKKTAKDAMLTAAN